MTTAVKKLLVGNLKLGRPNAKGCLTTAVLRTRLRLVIPLRQDSRSTSRGVVIGVPLSPIMPATFSAFLHVCRMGWSSRR